MKSVFIFFVLLFIIQVNGISQENKITTKKNSPQAMRSDFELLKNILEANHPSLYWYTPKDSIDFLFAKIYSS